MIQGIREAQRSLDERLLNIAIGGGYLPQGSTVKNLTNRVRERMLNDGKLKLYLPDGST